MCSGHSHLTQHAPTPQDADFTVCTSCLPRLAVGPCVYTHGRATCSKHHSVYMYKCKQIGFPVTTDTGRPLAQKEFP